MPDLAVILAVILIIFGPGKLPEIGSSIGKGIRNFKKATEDETAAQEKLEQTPPTEKIEQLEHKADPVAPPKNPQV
jgi:sec-independent protein translocase protein TatA